MNPRTHDEEDPPEQEPTEPKKLYEQRIISEREAYDWDHDISDVHWGND